MGHKHTCKLFLKKKILFTPMLNPARRGANFNKEQLQACPVISEAGFFGRYREAVSQMRFGKTSR